MIERLAHVPVEVDYGSEYRYRDPIVDKHTLVIAISQSGETADTLAAEREAPKGAKVLAICNVVGTMLTREASGTIYTHAGPEIGVASTKAFTGSSPLSSHGASSRPGARQATSDASQEPDAGNNPLPHQIERFCNATPDEDLARNYSATPIFCIWAAESTTPSPSKAR